MNSLLKKKTIWNIEAPPDNKEDWDAKLMDERKKYRHLFKNDQQCDLFNMLPITREEDKLRILKTMLAESEFEREIDNCKGIANPSERHKSRCVPCCILAKFHAFCEP